MKHLVPFLLFSENRGHFKHPAGVGTPVRVLRDVLLVVEQHLATTDHLTHQVHPRGVHVLGSKILGMGMEILTREGIITVVPSFTAGGCVHLMYMYMHVLVRS